MHGSCVYHDIHCDLQPWSWAEHLYWCLGQLSLPSSGARYNKYQLLGWGLKINGGCGCGQCCYRNTIPVDHRRCRWVSSKALVTSDNCRTAVHLLPCLLAFLLTTLRIGPYHFQARSHKRWSNLGLVFCVYFVLYYMQVCFCCVRFIFLSVLSQEIGREEHLRNYCVGWDIKPWLNQCCMYDWVVRRRCQAAASSASSKICKCVLWCLMRSCLSRNSRNWTASSSQKQK